MKAGVVDEREVKERDVGGGENTEKRGRYWKVAGM